MVAPTAQRSRSGPRRITAGSYSTMILRLAIVWAAVAPAGLAGAMARSGSADIRRAEQVRNMIWIYSRASGLTPALKGLCQSRSVREPAMAVAATKATTRWLSGDCALLRGRRGRRGGCGGGTAELVSSTWGGPGTCPRGAVTRRTQANGLAHSDLPVHGVASDPTLVLAF